MRSELTGLTPDEDDQTMKSVQHLAGGDSEEWNWRQNGTLDQSKDEMLV